MASQSKKLKDSFSYQATFSNDSFDKSDYKGAEAVVRRCSIKMVFLEISQNSQENTCARVSFLIKSKVFLCEFCKISKNKFFYRILPAAAFEGVINIKCRDIHGIFALLIVIRFWLHIKEKQILNVIVMVQLCKFRNL